MPAGDTGVHAATIVMLAVNLSFLCFFLYVLLPAFWRENKDKMETVKHLATSLQTRSANPAEAEKPLQVEIVDCYNPEPTVETDTALHSEPHFERMHTNTELCAGAHTVFPENSENDAIHVVRI